MHLHRSKYLEKCHCGKLAIGAENKRPYCRDHKPAGRRWWERACGNALMSGYQRRQEKIREQRKKLEAQKKQETPAA